MTRRRRARSNLYQVDFVAALFGAFLLLWISKTTSSTGEPEAAVVVIESFCGDQASLLPEGAERCVDDEILQLTDPSLNLRACAFKPMVRSTPESNTPSWDQEGPQTATAPLKFFSKAMGRDNLVRFSGLAVVVAAVPGQKFRAIGYGSSTPPDQISGAIFSGYIETDVCKKNSCPLYSYTFPSDFEQKCEIRLHSSAWPETCLRATVKTGDAAVPFALRPCRS